MGNMDLKEREKVTIPAELQERAEQFMKEKVQRFKDFAKLQPDHPFTLANQHMLNFSTQTSWNGTGVLSTTGVIWWALNLSVDLAYPNVSMFNATGGPDFDFSIFTSAVTGYYMVNPATLNGKYQFTMEAVAAVGGEVSIDLYDMNWSQVGSFLGVVVGVSVSKLNGTGTMTYNPG